MDHSNGETSSYSSCYQNNTQSKNGVVFESTVAGKLSEYANYIELKFKMQIVLKKMAL